MNNNLEDIIEKPNKRIMTTKSLKEFTELLNRSEGLSIIPIIAIMVIMSVMGVVFTSIMGGWKISAPMTINSTKAYNLAETAAMFALQDASIRFFSKDVNGVPNFPSLATGTRSDPFIVSSIVTSNGTETAEFWIERPNNSANPSVDLYPPGHPQAGNERGFDDDDDSSSDDDVVDDDSDDPGNPSLYTIIATGKVFRNGTTVAKRQIKIKATITDSTSVALTPGVHTDGVIVGSGDPDANPPPPSNYFGITDGGANVVGYADGTNILAEDPADDETGLVTHSAPVLSRDYFKAMAIAQGHYHTTDLTISAGNSNDDYPNLSPNGSFYYDYLAGTPSVPNITFIEGDDSDLWVSTNMTAWGIYWVDGDFKTNGNNSLVQGIVICSGNVELNGGGQVTGGIVHYGATLTGNGNPATITIDSTYFGNYDKTKPIINVQSWQEAVSAN